MKARITFDVDFEEVALGSSVEEALEGVKQIVILPARKAAIKALHGVRTDLALDHDRKAILLAERLYHIKLLLMMEANMRVEPLDGDAPISTQLPFEQTRKG